ncbi:hypothetical protein SAMN06295974_3797 [Plantibacter flavus]|uniref:Uncharacterized protein n=1 Tax=Plantibacter flavus TaxID=150123 RepID=A0A3N2BLB1_9MICO|nr:hypothetical protein [Plantibacter flavus]ROR76055.1 hypothetical protein EDD42_4008 [Plantibacter flavus]SMG48958.1 hypothetical protein SAMN06295974_3797 [Plantibacter flavus]
MPQPTITTPPLLNLTVPATPDRPSVKIRVAHDSRRGVYTTNNLGIEHPVIAVTPTLLGKMRLGAVRRDALRSALSEANDELAGRAPVKSYFRGSNGRAVSEKVRAEPTLEHLENLAIIYRLARLVGDFPVQSVARSFGLEPVDAQRWVAIARKSGSLA